ncbi:helix-turn-helix domain-containing protein [Thomasclavelia sp.]
MEELKMLTQEEVAKLLHTHVTTITTLREVGILVPIKTGRNFMFTQEEVKNFQRVYRGLDVSNRTKALESLKKISNDKSLS